MSELKEAKPKTIKVPGLDHPITIARNANRVVVKVAGRIVADTRDALILREASYAPVQYIPRKDVDMTLLAPTDHTTYCPYNVWTGCPSQVRWCCRKSLICIRPVDRHAGRGLDGSTHAPLISLADRPPSGH